MSNIPLVFRVQLSWFVVWFGLKLVDFYFPPYDPIFNATLATLAALSVMARHLDQ